MSEGKNHDGCFHLDDGTTCAAIVIHAKEGTKLVSYAMASIMRYCAASRRKFPIRGCALVRTRGIARDEAPLYRRDPTTRNDKSSALMQGRARAAA